MTSFQRFSLPVVAACALGALLFLFVPQDPRIAFAAAAGGIVLLGLFAAFRSIRLFPLIIMVSLIIGQLVRLSISSGSSGALLLTDIATGAYVTIGVIHMLLTKKSPPRTLSVVALIGVVGWMFISLLFGSRDLAGTEIIIALFYAIRFTLMIGAIIVTASFYPQKANLAQLLNWLIVTGIILVLLGFAQITFLPDFRFMARYGWDPHQGRMLSTYFDPNFFGMFLVIIFSLLLSRFFFFPKAQLTIVALLLFIAAAILLTYSRSSYLALLISLGIILTIRSWKLVLIMGIALTVVSLSIPRVKERIIGAITVDETAVDRIESWQETFVIIRSSPWIGVGYNAYGPAQVKYGLKNNLLGRSSQGSDSSALLILATMGVIGLAFFTFLFGSFLYEAVILYRHTKDPFWQSLGLAILGILPALLIHSQFVNSLFYPLILVPLTFLLATLIQGVRRLGTQA
ncbi:MAG TPA: O-antigen ligase family protein [Patescibacteria group bacterium]